MRQAEATGGGGIVASEGKEYRAATDRIDDREEGADDEKDTFCDFEQRILRTKEYSRAVPPLPLFCVSAESKGLKVACFDTLV